MNETLGWLLSLSLWCSVSTGTHWTLLLELYYILSTIMAFKFMQSCIAPAVQRHISCRHISRCVLAFNPFRSFLSLLLSQLCSVDVWFAAVLLILANSFRYSHNTTLIYLPIFLPTIDWNSSFYSLVTFLWMNRAEPPGLSMPVCAWIMLM